MNLTTAQRIEVIDKLSDWRWRLNNLYWITDKQGKRIPFRLNGAQQDFLGNLHHSNVTLKARQLGFSTLFQLVMLDAAVFCPDISCGTVAHTREDAEEIFKTKAKFPYDNLPDGVKDMNPATQDAARHLSFANNSSIRVGTSLRSGTLQYLHVSEYGKLCAQYPDKANEVKTGALNTVQAGQMIFVESTAEGDDGDFKEMCDKAQARAEESRRLTPLEFRFHFYGWFWDPSYRLPVGSFPISPDLKAYFRKLEQEHGINLTAEQQTWYAAKADQQGHAMKQEYPSTAEEAFEYLEPGGQIDIADFRRYTVRPNELTLYGASDYGVTEDTGSFTCHGVFGVDPDDNLYVLDWYRQQVDTSDGVDAGIAMMQRHKTVAWVEDKAQVERAVGPFLKKRLREQKIYSVFRVQLPTVGNKVMRMQSFRGRVGQGRVYVPQNAPWIDAFLREMKLFPNGPTDDQVDVCGLVGRILDHMTAAARPKKDTGPKPLTWDEAIAEDERMREHEMRFGR